MSFFDRFRSKWKHPDPVVREAAVPGIGDPSILEQLAQNDPADGVRIAAVRALTDQTALARVAAGTSSAALAAMRKLQDRKLVAKVAQTAASHLVRELAVEHIDDSMTLHRISSSDTSARVRLKARSRRSGPDPVRDFIRLELAKLEPCTEVESTEAGFRGTLDDVAANLVGDLRFRINGWLDHEIPGLAKVGALDEDVPSAPCSAARDSSPAPRCARFLAFKRTESGDPEEAASSHVYYEIKVWRTASDHYMSIVEERSLMLVANAAEWSRAASSTSRGERSTKESSKEGRRA